jgi:hypothetical protein
MTENGIAIEVFDGRAKPRFGAVYLDDLRTPTVQALKPTAFRLYMLLIAYCSVGPWGVSYPQLGADLGLGGSQDTRRKTVRDAVLDLEAAGLIEVSITQNGGGGRGWNVYRLRSPKGSTGAKYPPPPGGDLPPGAGGDLPPGAGGDSPPPSKTSNRSRNSTPLSPPCQGGPEEPAGLSAPILAALRTLDEAYRQAIYRLETQKRQEMSDIYRGWEADPDHERPPSPDVWERDTVSLHVRNITADLREAWESRRQRLIAGDMSAAMDARRRGRPPKRRL